MESKSVINIDKYRKLKAELREDREVAWKAYQAVRDKERDLLNKLVDLNGKYLRVHDVGTAPTYLYVTDQFETKYFSTDMPAIQVNGIGFRGTVTEYSDDTYLKWDEDMSFHIRLDNDFETDINNVEEITKEEFNAAFEDILSKVREEHYKFLKG